MGLGRAVNVYLPDHPLANLGKAIVLGFLARDVTSSYEEIIELKALRIHWWVLVLKRWETTKQPNRP